MATLAERLVDAEDAYHNLSTGKSVRVFVDQNGERVEYAVANLTSLRSYIADLKAQIAASVSGAPIIPGPMRSFFL